MNGHSWIGTDCDASEVTEDEVSARGSARTVAVDSRAYRSHVWQNGLAVLACWRSRYGCKCHWFVVPNGISWLLVCIQPVGVRYRTYRCTIDVVAD